MESDQREKGLNRRHFLQMTALTGAGLAGAGSLLRLPSLHAQTPPAVTAAGKCEQLVAASEKIPITTSIFELFKIGPGPSSSHTIAPMRAANDFMANVNSMDDQTLAAAQAIEVRLFGSLSATGKGHGTDWAILAGILGQKPETCAPEFLDALKKDKNASYQVRIGKKDLPISDRQIIFDKVEHSYPFSNTIIMRLLGDKSVLLEKEYYSIGGGFIQWKGWTEPKRGTPAYPYGNMTQLKELLDKNKIPLHRLVLENEKAIMGAGEAEIYSRLDLILKAMEASVQEGLKGEGVLPGPVGLNKRAGDLNRKARKLKQSEARFLVRISAYAIAGAEENAMGHRIVTAPTAGSAGVLPAIAYMMKYQQRCSRQTLREGLLAATAVGFLAKHNASIAGAEAGCQGEIGVAASMAAAMLAYAQPGHPIRVVEDAAAIAMQHHLGMTCDPVFGYVQIPCIERCAMGAVKAYNAFLIASVETAGYNKVSFDVVIRTMAATGRDMSSKYKETSQGGLAVYMVSC